MRKYYKHHIEKAIQVKSLITIEYIEMPKGFRYPEESHDFFEFIYVEKGALTCCIDNVESPLTQDDFTLIPQNKSHKYVLKDNQSAKALILCFSCKSDVLNALEDKITLSDKEKTIIENILSESRNCFEFPFKKKLIPLKNPRFASQQLVEGYVEQLLINVIRQQIDRSEIKFVTSKKDFDLSLTKDIENLLINNLYNDVNLDFVCKNSYYSKTYLNNVFHDVKGYTIMQYYNLLKINEAKKLLKKGNSIASISIALCFESPNYFTKVFKKFVGTTPSAYKKNVKKDTY